MARAWTRCVLAALFLVAGCAPAVKLDPPKVDAPAAFEGTAMPEPGGPVTIRTGAWPDLSWWRIFEDPQLETLIGEALARNNDLTVAAQQIEVARARVRVSRAALLPQASVSPAVKWQRFSNNGLFFKGDLIDSYAVPVTLSYEFDFWNKNGLALQSSKALARASEQDWRTLYIGIVSDVAATYFDIATTLARQQITEDTLASYREYYKVIQRRHDKGMASALDLQRGKAQVSSTEATVPDLRLRVQRLQHRLSSLLGRPPGEAIPVRMLNEARVPGELPGGVPAGLLQRRPDIQAQRERLEAAIARTGVARALFFPDMTLNLAVGAASISTGSLFLPGSFAMDMLAGLTQPLFRGGELEANLDASIATYRQEAAAYQQTVLTAFRETADAVSEVQELTRRRDRLVQAVADEQRAYELSNRAYRAGTVSYLDVLDAQRSLLAAREAVAQAEGQRIVAMISLYKSLGGGWEPTLPDHPGALRSAR